MLILAGLGLVFSTSMFVFLSLGLIVWITISLWRIGKEAISLTGWGATGMIVLSVVTEAGLGILSRILSNIF